MKEFDTDILIVGSGLVGLVAANSLSHLGCKVILVDRENFLSPKNFENGQKCFFCPIRPNFEPFSRFLLHNF